MRNPFDYQKSIMTDLGPFNKGSGKTEIDHENILSDYTVIAYFCY